MGLANQKELAPKGLVTLVIYPRTIDAAAPTPVLDKSQGHTPEPLRAGMPEPLRGGIPWVSCLLVFLLAAGVTFAAVYVHELWSGPALSMPRFLQPIFPGTGLGLKVEYEGDRLLITWSRTSPAVRSAVQGVLRINDGGQQRDVIMDSTQVVAGSVLYKPASNDVTFRLEVQNDQGKATAESIRVLDSGKPPPAAAPGEKPASNAAPTVQPSAAPRFRPAREARPRRPLTI
ncbi:MAG TPA: hypothetical protein VMF91_27135 [Bryobacteraceae bacterium]|nr:hypothetical protein [Bryobacteraceae bacterium]